MMLDTFEISSPELKEKIRVKAHDAEEAVWKAKVELDIPLEKYEDFLVVKIK